MDDSNHISNPLRIFAIVAILSLATDGYRIFMHHTSVGLGDGRTQAWNVTLERAAAPGELGTAARTD